MNHPYLEIISRLNSSPNPLPGTRLVTIDGPAGSGKTSLAAQLSSRISATIIHMDDLYDGWEDPLGSALTLLLQESLLPALKLLRRGEPFQLPHYNWHTREWYLSDPYPISDVTILEGVGAGQRLLRPSVSLALWIEAPEKVARMRVLERDGYAIADEMERFHRFEQEHFAKEESKSAADYHLLGI